MEKRVYGRYLMWLRDIHYYLKVRKGKSLPTILIVKEKSTGLIKRLMNDPL